MPQLRRSAAAPPASQIEFAFAPALDLLNAMYFTFLAGDYEGVGEWPLATRGRMDPSLQRELDELFTYPRGEPGIMGALTDTSFSQRQVWGSLDALLAYIRDLPAGGSADPSDLGIQGLAMHALRWPCDVDGYAAGPEVTKTSRSEFAHAVASGDEDVSRALTLFDDPEQVRARMMRLIRRFYDEHYRPDEDRRLAIGRRSIESHRALEREEPQAVLDRIAGRHVSCFEETSVPYTMSVFVPSVDVGAYLSCADTPPIHGVFFAADAGLEVGADADENAEKMALVYKALADPQRLRILRLLGDGELYVQEIVERTGVHQSVVSRHLSFLKAVGLVAARRQNNMKFFSLNLDMRQELRQAVDTFMPAR